MNLALFDLDHTLLPIDSDYEWSRYLLGHGVVDSEHFAAENERFFREYQQGTLDIDEFLQFQLAPLAATPRERLDQLHQGFMADVINPVLQPQARELVARHQQAGDLCAIVTATNEFVTGPIARTFGIEHLIATRVEVIDGAITGRTTGTPSFREGKVARTHEWLATLALELTQFEQSWFYSDSANDLPLLELVTRPVATNPDERLAGIARERNWPILRLFE